MTKKTTVKSPAPVPLSPASRAPVTPVLEAAGDHVIRVRGAKAHNLKNVDVDIPKDKLVVSWSEDIEPLDGVNDFKKRRTAIRVFPK